MATYKVLQDIEAEDKILGPLTLKQFIFAIITMALCFVAFLFGRINIIFVVPWLIPIAFFGFMASPIGRDQPNDVWLAARLRFLIKPRRRIWDQSGMTDLVTINAPKKIEITRTNGLNQYEVHSRLKALANTMDSRGWAIKNVNVNMFVQPSYLSGNTDSDRLIDITNIPQEVSNNDVKASDDILDPMNNMVAQRFDTAIKQMQEHRLNSLREAAQNGTVGQQQQSSPVDYSFINHPQQPEPGYTTFGAQVITPGAQARSDDGFLAPNKKLSDSEEAFLEKRHHDIEVDKSFAHPAHERVVKTPEELRREQAERAKAEVKKAPDGILKELGQTGSDLSVASLASLAKHAEQEAALHNDDVISLH